MISITSGGDKLVHPILLRVAGPVAKKWIRATPWDRHVVRQPDGDHPSAGAMGPAPGVYQRRQLRSLRVVSRRSAPTFPPCRFRGASRQRVPSAEVQIAGRVSPLRSRVQGPAASGEAEPCLDSVRSRAVVGGLHRQDSRWRRDHAHRRCVRSTDGGGDRLRSQPVRVAACQRFTASTALNS